MRSRLIGLLTAAAIFNACAVFAQTAQPWPYSCRSAQGGGTLHVNGFAVAVWPDPDPNPDSRPDWSPCHATIRSPLGDVVFKTENASIMIGQATGQDLNGDGKPDAVILSNTGGMHCCSVTSIVSLGASPGLIRDISSEVSMEDLDGDGRREIVVWDSSFGYFDELPYAFSPFPILIFRLQGSRFEEVSASFLKRYDEQIGTQRQELAATGLERLLHSDRSDEAVYAEAKGGVLSIVLDYLYSHRPKQAWEALNQYWPPADRELIRGEIIERYCATVEEFLGPEATASCADDSRAKQ